MPEDDLLAVEAPEDVFVDADISGDEVPCDFLVEHLGDTVGVVLPVKVERVEDVFLLCVGVVVEETGRDDDG